MEYEFYYFVDMIYGDLVKLAFHDEKMIGILYSFTDITDVNVFEIASIGCLPEYRRLGVGSYLLEYALDYVAEKARHKVIRLYVQTKNEIALEFYKKYGFEIIKEVPNYYFYTLNNAAYQMEKVVHSEFKMRRSPMNQSSGSKLMLENKSDESKRIAKNMTAIIPSLLAMKLKEILHQESDKKVMNT